MIIDARSLPSEEILETEVCIVGGGPAGITLAREFANQRFKVCLLESGGLEREQNIQSLSEGKVIGNPYPNLQEGRCRQFGGTAHYWEAQVGYGKFGWRCLPLDEIDFEKRDWLPYSGWPFTKSHLDPFYEIANQVCQLGEYTYKVEDWESSSARSLFFKSDRLKTTISQYGSRTPFTHEYRNEIARADNIITLLHANVLEIETDKTAQTVTSLRVGCLSGNCFSVKGKIFVLATGGIENARLLLLSNQIQKAGLGNQNDLVGRFFMDRPIVSCGTLIPSDRRLFDLTNLYDVYNVKGIPIMARVQLTEDLMRREQLMNNGAQLFPRATYKQRESISSLKTLLSSISKTKLPDELLKQLNIIAGGFDYVAAATFWSAIRKLPGLQRGGWSYLPYEKRRFSSFELIYQIEQAPDPNNRVVLSTERDLFSQNKLEIHWKLNDIDLRTIARVREIWVEEFAKAGLGELKLSGSERELKFDKLAMYHHMGTTRMHDNPKQGVVDANCRVHGMTNLFIAGSSVFPTAGYANPTLTIVALAIRLADRIKTLITK